MELIEIIDVLKDALANSTVGVSSNPHRKKFDMGKFVINVETIMPKNLKKQSKNKKPKYPIALIEEKSEDSIREEKPQTTTVSTNSNHKKYKSSIAQSLYEPFLKKNYLRGMSENFKNIKMDTRKNIKGHFYLSKKEDEIRNIAKEGTIFNNPSKNTLKRIKP